MAEQITLHQTVISHPCMAVRTAMELKGLDYETVDYPISPQRAETMEQIFGEGRRTVPGILIGEEKVHGSRAIMARLEGLAPDPALYPPDASAEFLEAERWADEVFQEVARRLPFAALHFRPEKSGTYAGIDELDPAGTDAAIKGLRSIWKWQGITAVRTAEDLAALPGQLDYIDELDGKGMLGAETPSALGLQVAATARILLAIGDLVPLIEPRSVGRMARELYPEYPGDVPAGALPASWMPSA
jgi:glutathione S-transferase